MTYILTPFAAACFSSALVSLFTVFTVIQWRRSGRSTLVIAIMAASAEWALTGGLEASACDTGTKIFWSVLEYVGMNALLPLIVLFAFHEKSARDGRPLRGKVLLFIPPAFMVVSAATNPWHRLLWRDFLPAANGSNSLRYVHGPLFWVVTALLFAYSAVAAWGLLLSARRAPGHVRTQNLTLSIMMLFPWIGCAVYVIPHRFSWDFDPVLAGYLVTSLIFSWASVRYRAFDPVPVAREAVLEQMAEGVAAVDLEDRIVYSNPSARSFTADSRPVVAGSAASGQFSWWPGAGGAQDGERGEMIRELPSEGEGPARTAEIELSDLRGAKGRRIGRLAMMRDVTTRWQAEVRLRHANERLEALDRKHSEDLALAKEIQRSLVAEGRISFPGVTFRTAYMPCEDLGGDMVGVLRIDEAHIALYAGDVCGHGVFAALVMSYVKKVIETSLKRVQLKGRSEVKPPGPVLSDINRQFIAEINRGRPDIYLTLFLGILDCSDLSFQFSSAGTHVPPLVISSGKAAELYDASDLPIGVAEDPEYRTSIARFAPGDVLFLVSDGVTECSRDGEPFGMDRLKATAFRELSGAAEPDLAGIIAAVEAYRSEGVQEDDMCFLAMSVRREGGAEK